MTPSWLEEAKGLQEAATPGPWCPALGNATVPIDGRAQRAVIQEGRFTSGVALTGYPDDEQARADAEAIANARTSLPRAIGVIEVADAWVAAEDSPHDEEPGSMNYVCNDGCVCSRADRIRAARAAYVEARPRGGG